MTEINLNFTLHSKALNIKRKFWIYHRFMFAVEVFYLSFVLTFLTACTKKALSLSLV
jgi:hypothetical protein